MKQLLRLSWYLLLIGIIASCSKPEQPLYQGLTMDAWVKRLESHDEEIRADALKVIAEIGQPAFVIEPKVRHIAVESRNHQTKLLAIKALEAMGATTVEFREFLEFVESPIIPFDEDPVELIEDNEGFDRNISGDDDLEYIKELLSTTVDSARVKDTVMVPKDSAELALWMRNRQLEGISALLNQLSNPKVLALLLESGDEIERRFAALKLGEMSGDDEDIAEALEEALNDADGEVAKAAEDALKNWSLP